MAHLIAAKPSFVTPEDFGFSDFAWREILGYSNFSRRFTAASSRSQAHFFGR